MQRIDFTFSNYVGFGSGVKKTTVRLGYKNYTLGSVKLTCSSEQLSHESEIIEIRKIRFGDIGLREANEDGFNTVAGLRHDLQTCYKRYISDHEPVTIVRFDI